MIHSVGPSPRSLPGYVQGRARSRRAKWQPEECTESESVSGWRRFSPGYWRGASSSLLWAHTSRRSTTSRPSTSSTKKAADERFINVGETATAATIAITATAATNATNAANADRLDGLDSSAFKLACPAGTRLFLGVCIEETSRPTADWGAAINACADLGRRLPSIGELWAFRLQPGITLAGSTFATSEMTQDLYFDSGVFGFIAVGEDGTAHERQGMLPLANPYRCVASPSN